jgi:hypothetical protein
VNEFTELRNPRWLAVLWYTGKKCIIVIMGRETGHSDDGGRILLYVIMMSDCDDAQRDGFSVVSFVFCGAPHWLSSTAYHFYLYNEANCM